MSSTKRERRAGLERRARAALLGGIALFVASQLAARVWIEVKHPELRDPTFELKYRQLTHLLDESPKKPALLLFLGSSMTAHGAKAGMVDATLTSTLDRPVVGFNLAITAGGPLTHLLYLQRLARRGIRPELVVFELSPLLYDCRDAPSDIGRYPPEVLAWHDPDTVDRYAVGSEPRPDWWPSFLVPVYGNRLTILNQAAPIFVPFVDRLELWDDMDEHGWRPRPAAPPPQRRETLANVTKAFSERFAKYQIGEPPLKALKEALALLARERIPTVLVLMPEGPMFRSLYPPGVLAPLFDEFAALSRQHGFPLINARTWLDEEKFFDSFHQTDAGAAEFTDRLVREIAATMNQVRLVQR